jgi:hypothetical protein
MPQQTKIFRVFVSSTFSDMKHERNALEADAFPKLEQLCQRHGFQFQAIDLRWGVSTEAGLDHRTMRICFDELRRAQEISPGYHPAGQQLWLAALPEEIFGRNSTHSSMPSRGYRSTGKSAVAVLREWYRGHECCSARLSPAIPPSDLGDDEDYTHDAVWNQVQPSCDNHQSGDAPEQLQRRFDMRHRMVRHPPLSGFKPLPMNRKSGTARASRTLGSTCWRFSGRSRTCHLLRPEADQDSSMSIRPVARGRTQAEKTG